MVDIPDDINLVDYDEKDPEDDPEEEPEEDVDIELEDDAELIFPYEKTRGRLVPEATYWDITQKLICYSQTFKRVLFEVGESSSAHDSSHVNGLAPWALRRDLEASCAQARAMERALGNVLERMSVLESRENVTLKKNWLRLRLQWCWLRMVRKKKRLLRMRLHGFPECGNKKDVLLGYGSLRQKPISGGDETLCGSQRWWSLWCWEMVGRVAVPEITRCTYITFMKCDPQPFKGTEGAVGLCQWFEKLESVFRISDCKERDKVKFATATPKVRAIDLGGIGKD
ncbi:hypothetical protein Tco_0729785 [Tanacetum coccineum]|uniref:Reverse transcriptase domain-containing protein n=1 Tax=Tanacetum coccineum TaxID=301880 RepID=A0ABQ4YPV2_9ASTR